MKKNYYVLIVLILTAVIPCNISAQEAEIIFRQEGIASWYGAEYDGRPTASGEIFDSTRLTAAHLSLPFGTIVEVTNTHNNKKVNVVINDRGPFVSGRIIDVSKAAAEQLDMIITGTAPVIVESSERIVLSSPAADQTLAVQTLPDNPAGALIPGAVSTPQTTDVFYPAAEESTIVYVTQPEIARPPEPIRLIPQINIIPERVYRLQVGSYRVARNAVDAFERLKNFGLNPAYERYIDSNNDEFFRVVLAGINGNDLQAVTDKITAAGFPEAVIREER